MAEYEYDATKQRIVKSIYASGVLDQRQHFYYNDRWQVVETRRELSGSEDSDPLAQYVWHPYYVDAIILRDYDSDTDGSAVRYYYTQDVNFNVLSVLSSSGAVLERYGYSPYGQAEALTANFTPDSDGLSDSANDITFTGQRYDSESRLMLYRHRYYHPVIGTFCSRDPLEYVDGQNLYKFLHSSPLIHTDAMGLQAEIEKPDDVIVVPIPCPDDGCTGSCFEVEKTEVDSCSIKSAEASSGCPFIIKQAIYWNPSVICEEMKKMITPTNKFTSDTCSKKCSCQDKQNYDGKTIKVKMDKTKIKPDPTKFKIKVDPEKCSFTVTGEVTLKVGKGWVGTCKTNEEN